MSPPKVRRPWWTYAVLYPGPVPDLAPTQWRVLGLLALAELFDQYDIGLMGLALLQIQQDLGISETQVGTVTALVRLGVLAAFLLTVLADRMGRRRLLLFTILGFTLCTFGTAFVQTPEQFVALQLLARAFIYAETMLAVVVVSEELAAPDRGFGIGLLGALGSLGHGVAALAFGFVDVLPFGWRALYALGVIPLLFLAWFRRHLPETRRFEEHAATRGAVSGWRATVDPALRLVRMYPGRMAALAAAIFPLDLVIIVAITFNAKFLQETHAYEPWQVTTLFLTGGALGILGNVAAGVLSDRFGRKQVIAWGSILTGVSYGVFYNAGGFWVPIAWVGAIFGTTGVSVLFKALGTELFPTSYRSTASGMREICGTLGGVVGLALEPALYVWTGSHAAAITLLLPILLVPPLVIGFAVPETASRELEEIAPERE